MKNITIRTNCLFGTIILFLWLPVHGQTPQLKDVTESELSFTHSLIAMENNTVWHLNVKLDRRQVKKISEVFYKVGTQRHYGDVKSGIVHIDALEGRKVSEKFKVKDFTDDSILLDLGKIDQGSYYITLRIKDSKDNRYIGYQKVTTPKQLSWIRSIHSTDR
ncbi:MAG: hypothetical protein MI975_29545 [Cytophagales bacterium]|nr:hypothetical protein [Cytophagales bacterium]